ncbi:MAG: phosphoribosylamine--glycine ligase [Legionellales bacterium]|nr:phosphoribosylamine--glycine ligase [Legionellales bacterium]
MNILILGSGGREHTFAWKISKSPLCKKLYISPGNGGTSKYGKNIYADINNFDEIKNLVINKKIDLVLVGPEDPLVNGIVDYFEQSYELKNVKIFGPNKLGAQLEGSKAFSKSFMKRHNIPSANFKSFNINEVDEGIEFLRSSLPPFVLKADGLAAGKGVIISKNLEDAENSFQNMLVNKQFGKASEKVLIEEFLSGIEISCFIITDGENYISLPEAKDYKRIGENDTGLNTGGMGAVSPVNFYDKEFEKKVKNRIIKRTIEGLKKDNIPFKGFLFIGLMNVNGDPYVIEYNVRMGDPETQVVIPRIKNDFLEVLISCINMDLQNIKINIDKKTTSTVILSSKGYPKKYQKGFKISGLNEIKNSIIFHAGTIKEENDILSNGGRVIACTGIGQTISESLKISYELAKKIDWEGKYYRKDIGKDLINNK